MIDEDDMIPKSQSELVSAGPNEFGRQLTKHSQRSESLRSKKAKAAKKQRTISK